MRWVLCGLLFVLAGCQSVNSLSGDTVGSGPIKFSSESYAVWEKYLKRVPIVFAVTPDGRHPYYYYCTEVGCQPPRFVSYVLQKCQERYKTPCRLFAMEDEIVWENPGDWKPTENDIDAEVEAFLDLADPEEHIPMIEEQIAGFEKIDVYRKSPKHKALALVFDPSTGKLGVWGTGFRYSSRRAAIEGAFKRCLDGNQVRYHFCRMYEVDGEVVWPKHKDELLAGD